MLHSLPVCTFERSLPALAQPLRPGSPGLQHSLSGSRALNTLTILLGAGQRPRELPLIWKGAARVAFHRTSEEWVVGPACTPVCTSEDDFFLELLVLLLAS